jgi:plasmid stabilization system protein ParE
MSRYVLTAEAQQDMRAIHDYLIAEGGPRVTLHVVSAFIVAFRRLSKISGMGHRREDLTSGGDLLFWPVFSYVIVYMRGSKPLKVVAVLRGNRDVARLLRERSV